jgi:hypothetical protein
MHFNREWTRIRILNTEVAENTEGPAFAKAAAWQADRLLKNCAAAQHTAKAVLAVGLRAGKHCGSAF